MSLDIDYYELLEVERTADDATLKARLMIETGRFPTAQAGTYWLKVVDKKLSIESIR